MDLIEAAVENQSTLITKENLTRLLNAIRLLTRILPFLFELDQNNVQDPFYNMFWIVDEGVNAGMKLVQNVVKLLFLRGFTLPDIVSDTPGVHYIIW